MRPVLGRGREIAVVLALIAAHAPLERTTRAVLEVMHPEVRPVEVMAVARDHHDLARTGRRVHGVAHRLAILHAPDDRNVPIALAETTRDVVEPQPETARRWIERFARLQIHAV